MEIVPAIQLLGILVKSSYKFEERNGEECEWKKKKEKEFCLCVYWLWIKAETSDLHNQLEHFLCAYAQLLFGE